MNSWCDILVYYGASLHSPGLYKLYLFGAQLLVIFYDLLICNLGLFQSMDVPTASANEITATPVSFSSHLMEYTQSHILLGRTQGKSLSVTSDVTMFTITGTSTSKLTETPLPSSSSGLNQGGRTIIKYRRDYLVLEVIAPVSAGTILVVVVVCVVGVCCCYGMKRTSDYKLK